MAERVGRFTRETGETAVTVELVLDGRGECTSTTGIAFLDHMLNQLGRHGRFDLTVTARGDLAVDSHHTAEDIAIALGRAFDEALGDRRGLLRMAHAIVPLDEALALVAVDISGRGLATVTAEMSTPRLGDLDSDMVGHFLDTFAREAGITLHASILRGLNDHHKAEALFKALARALDQATALDPRVAGDIPSTKGVIDRR